MDQALIDAMAADLDHHDPRLGDVSHEVYRAMRERCPIAHSDHYDGFWIITGFDEAHDAYQRYDLFTAYPTVNIPAGAGHRRPMLPLEVDPPIHGKYRSLLAPVFSPPRIQALEPTIRKFCDELIDAFIDRGKCEFVSEFASPFPTMIFGLMMDVPMSEAQQCHRWKDMVLHGHADDPDGTKRAQAGADLQAYLSGVHEDRKAHRRDDIISLLLDSEVDGEKLTDDELLDITYLLFIAGLDTVTSELGLQFLYLSTHPEVRDQIVNTPEIIPQAVEELLRFESLVLTGRTVTKDLEFHGVRMKEGDRLIINSVAANRDPAQFPDPDTVVLDRTPNRHLAFAAGPHRCVGSHLARLELTIVLERMHARIPTYRLEDDADVQRHASSVAGLGRLPLVWD